LVEIASVDPKAPPIKVEVNFAEKWNGKALMYGGGGYNGLILSTGGTIRLQPPDVPSPLAQGLSHEPAVQDDAGAWRRRRYDDATPART
jgi:hypothetical protein